MTGIGPVAIRQPRVRDREAAEGERIWYSPSFHLPESHFEEATRSVCPGIRIFNTNHQLRSEPISKIGVREERPAKRQVSSWRRRILRRKPLWS